MRALICLLGISAACQAQIYTITTAAGGANPYFYTGTGDGGQATSAGLANPCNDVALDGMGNLYIVAGTLIRKVTSAGIISTWAGGGASLDDYVPATTAQISPIALASDTAGNLYIADTAFGNSRIRKIDTTGTITTIAGGAPCCALGDGGPATSAYIGIPYGVGIDAAGNLYIAQSDNQNNLVRKVSTANGVISTVAGGGAAVGDGGQATAVSLARPTGVAVDGAGNFFIAEANGNRVRKVSGTGVISTVAGNGAANNLGDGGSAMQAGVDSPWHVALDSGGNIYITQINDARVRLVMSGGTIMTIAGTGVHGFSGDGGPATMATLDRPAGIVVSAASGGAYIADATSGIARVRLLTPTGATPAITGVSPVYSPANTIEPGEWVSIYGSNLASGTANWNADFPTLLGGTSVMINGKAAYLSYVSPGQINLQAPDDTATGAVQVVVTNTTGSATSMVTLGEFGPCFALLDGKHVAGIILRTDGSGTYGGGAYDIIGPTGTSLGFKTVAAKAGDVLELFGTGFGATSPAVPSGKPFAGAAPAVNPVNLLINSVGLSPLFAGLAGPGLYQFNLILPSGLGTGDVPLQAIVGGVSTPNGVVISLQ